MKKKLNLYLISQKINNDYDTYDSAVVCAPDESTAKNMNPESGLSSFKDDDIDMWSSWCGPEYVQVVFLGKADPATQEGVVLASFNAG
jgi:hypothetical protein